MGPPRLTLATLCFFLASRCAGQSTSVKPKPAPVSLTPSEYWDGSDGEWSSFTLRLGGSGANQEIRVFPATSGYQIWAVTPKGCPMTPNPWQGGRDVCVKQRGGLYNSNSSGTFTPAQPYNMSKMKIAEDYGFTDLVLDYGWETVTLGYLGSYGDNPPAPLSHMLVGELAEIEFTTVGLIGLDPKQTNWSDVTNKPSGEPSLLWTLQKSSVIPSQSYGYTAGAHYKNPPVLGSLVLGGYDSNLFRESSGSTFPFDTETEAPLVVPLKTIDLFGSTSMVYPGYIKIDSTRAWIYLPHDMALTIANTFGLAYSNNDGSRGWNFLLVNAQARTRLLASGRSLTFRFPSFAIDLPIAALIQVLDYPYIGTKTWHIPIRPTNKTEQYVLGRTFLQHAYLKVDYEKSEFGLYPAAFPERGTKEVLVPVHKNTDNWKLPISRAVLGGILGAVVALLLALIGLLFCLRRKKKQQAKAEAEMEEHKLHELSGPLSPSTPHSLDNPMELKGFEAKELDSATVHESGGTPTWTHSELQSYPHTPAVDNTAFGGFYKETKENGSQPIIKVYYEMDASPEGTSMGSTLSNSSTLVGSTGTTVPGIQDMMSPIPQTPLEYYDRSHATDRAGDATLPPQAPLDFYHRPRLPARAGDRSSIPETPLEYYGPAAVEGRAGERGWIGRVPNANTGAAAVVGAGLGAGLVGGSSVADALPRVTLTPATPVGPSERDVERSRWLRGYSGRRKDGIGEEGNKI